MDQEAALETVRTLTKEAIAQLNPAGLDHFADDFAGWAVTRNAPRAAESSPPPRGEALDTTLVAGMFFRVLLEAHSLPATLPERVSFVRKEAKNYLVRHLSGQITLSRFYRLINLIEENVLQYFQRQRTGWLAPEPGPGEKTHLPAPPGASAEELHRGLARVELPPKGRKLTREGLADFLLATGGEWFRVLDLETRFRVNKKTAWSCLHLLLQSGILEHNGEKANRARYALGRQFQAKS
ncbi:MAG: hypothetical protein FJ126_01555 [Deltaproteobacteria bacterium]|nr:hypothetical protein [Deltaproteobacteria bacterium]